MLKGLTGILLDTHVLVWWRLDAGHLTKAQIDTIETCERDGVGFNVSAITIWELAKLVQLGRLHLPAAIDLWLPEIEDNPLITVLPLTAAIALEGVRLGPDFPKDPADQIIVATARVHGLTLITADERIRNWGRVSLA